MGNVGNNFVDYSISETLGIFQILKIKNYFKQFMVGNPRIQEAEAGG